MTEVPEHLLRRSRERREALGLDGGGAGGASGGDGDEAPAAAPAAAASAEVEPQAAAAAPAVPEPEPEPEVTYIAKPDPGRSRNPLWVMPVLLALPMWALFYAYAFAPAKKAGPVDPLVRGAEVYKSAGCSSCHGANGEGGVGPALHAGEAVKTFPTEADHIKWVQTGSAPSAGQKYGDPNREGGQHGPAKGLMPAFSGQLSQSDIEAVVKFEREKL